MKRILPVIDLQDGKVVHAVGGKRHQYGPIQSRLASNARPGNVARGLVDTFSFHEVYVADLDAIAGAEPDWESLRSIAECGLTIWLDAGLRNARQVGLVERFGQHDGSLGGIVVASESVASPQALKAVFDALGDPRRAVFSLDLNDGNPLFGSPAWDKMSVLEMASFALDVGFRNLLVLDLAHVGSDRGPGLLSLCERLRRDLPISQLLSGGGVRSLDDVSRLYRAGCDRVLVASMLHDGRINAASMVR